MAFTDEQRQNAAIIRQVGLEVGASERDIQIAIMTALQESGLRNLNYGDRDSLGLFQQRPSMNWGSRAQVTDPHYAAQAFFLGAGTNKGLLDYKQRDQWSLTQAAQKVQRSAYPDAYAKHESAAAELLSSLGGTPAPTTATSGAAQITAPADAPLRTGGGVGAAVAPGVEAATAPGVEAATMPGAEAPTGAPAGAPPLQAPFLPDISEDEYGAVKSQATGALGAQIADFARRFVGTPYKWGGSGPLGFDCSGLLQYAFQHFGVELPRVSYQQASAGTRIAVDQAQIGDLWAIDNSSRNNGADHIALYLGDGKILEAPRAGLNVRIRDLSEDEKRSGWFQRVL